MCNFRCASNKCSSDFCCASTTFHSSGRSESVIISQSLLAMRITSLSPSGVPIRHSGMRNEISPMAHYSVEASHAACLGRESEGGKALKSAAAEGLEP